MCKASHEPGGPQRCSGDARRNYQQSAAAVRTLEQRLADIVAAVRGSRASIFGRGKGKAEFDGEATGYYPPSRQPGRAYTAPNGATMFDGEDISDYADRVIRDLTYNPPSRQPNPPSRQPGRPYTAPNGAMMFDGEDISDYADRVKNDLKGL